MKGFVLLMMACVVYYAFEQALRWDIIEILAAMAALLFVPPFIVDRLLSKTAQRYCEANENWVWGLVIGVTVLTFIVYQIGDTPFHDYISEEITIFIGLWWCCWPYGCAGVLIADRVFHLFDKLSPPPSGGGGNLLDRLQLDSEPDWKDPATEPESAYIFDITRYKKDKLH